MALTSLSLSSATITASSLAERTRPVSVRQATEISIPVAFSSVIVVISLLSFHYSFFQLADLRSRAMAGNAPRRCTSKTIAISAYPAANARRAEVCGKGNAAAPFAQGLVAGGRQLGIDEFLLVQ